jgi:transposase-like protein
MATMAKRYPREFREDVIRVARLGQSSRSQIARDFGISEPTLYHWLRKADSEDGVREGMTEADAAEMRALRARNRVLEQEVEILRRATAFFAKDLAPK